MRGPKLGVAARALLAGLDALITRLGADGSAWRWGQLHTLTLEFPAGLPFDVDIANDPFFGRTGRLLAASQREESLKFELLVPIHAKEHPTACVSFNYHRDLFGHAWKIETAIGRDRPYRLRRLRRRAHHAGAVQASRLCGRALARFGARCPRALSPDAGAPRPTSSA